MAKEPENVAVPDVVTERLVQFQQAANSIQAQMQAYLSGVMAGAGLDVNEWRISPDGMRFVRNPSQGDSKDG